MPRAGLEPVRVGPETVEAGDAASRLIGGNAVDNQMQASELIKANAAAHPKEMRDLQRQPEDLNRSATLDLDEVEKVLSKQIGEENVAEVLGGRVRGTGPEKSLQVVVLYEYPSGRTARASVSYSDLSKSAKAYDKALKAGDFDTATSDRIAQPDSADDAETAELKEALRKAEQANAELRAQQTAAVGAPDTTGETPAPDPGAGSVELPEDLLKTVATAKKGVGALSDEQLDAAEAAEESDANRAGVLKAIKAERKSRTES